MVKAMASSEDAQFQGMAGFIPVNKLSKFLQQGDWENFARRYNEPGFKKNRYDEKLADEHARYLNLETAVGCARVCRERRAWQGETKQRTEVANEEQRSQARRARCNRVHSAVT